MNRLGLCISLLMISFSSVSEVMRWTDEEGNVHFGDTVPVEHQESAEAVEHPPINTVAPEDNIRYQNSQVVQRYRAEDEQRAREARERQENPANKPEESSQSSEPAKLTREYCRNKFINTKALTECFHRVERQNQ